MKNRKLFGTLCGIAAAVAYGTNPLGALKLYAEGMNTPSVLFYRFALAWVIIAAVMAVRCLPVAGGRRETLRVTRKEFAVVTGLGLLFIGSSLTLYLSFRVMEAGVASTILFTYPVMTAAIMAIFFHERLYWVTVASIVLSFVGVALLYRGDGTATLPVGGVVLVLLSALTYALYIILVNRSNLQMSSFKINFYVLFYCALGMVGYAIGSGQPLLLPPTPTAWFYVDWLAIVPAIMALVLMVYAAKYVGSTTTAILAVGIVLILGSVVLIVARKEEKA